MSQAEELSPTTAVRPPAPARLATGQMLAYGVPTFALSSFLFFVQFYFLKFATDALLLAPATVGLVFALGRAWDAVSDPVAGTWSDRTRTKLGRRRPWMLAGVPLLAASFAMVWMPPDSLGSTALVAWTVVALFGFYTAFTIYIVPHQSLGAELSDDHHDRSRIFGLRHASFTVGMMAAFGAIQFVTNADDTRAAAASVAWVMIAVSSLVLLVPPVLLKERSEFQGRGAERPLRALRDVLRNPHARLLLAVQFIEMTGAGVLGILSPFVMEYVLKRPDLIGPLPAAFVVCSVLSIPFWVRASARFGKKQTWRVAMVGFALSFGATWFAGENDWLLISVTLVFAGISAGCGGAVGPSILADVIDYDELQSGERKEGAYSAAWGFSIKAANALIVLLVGVALQLSGFEPNVEQSEASKLALISLFALTPLVMFLAGALLFSRFSLDHDAHTRIRAELDSRRSTTPEPRSRP